MTFSNAIIYDCLAYSFQGHSDEVFVLECHPHEPYIYLSAGNCFCIDLVLSSFCSVRNFWNRLLDDHTSKVAPFTGKSLVLALKIAKFLNQNFI